MTFPISQKYVVNMASQATGADFRGPVCEAPFVCDVSSVKYIPAAAATGGAIANSRIYNLYNRGQGAYTGTTLVASFALTSSGAVNLVDNTPQALTLQTSANRRLAAGDVLEIESLHRTTGQDDPGGTFVVTLTRVSA